MRVLLASDIFGQTPALDALLTALETDVLVLDPYGGERLNFPTEAEAYRYFQSNVGLETYSAKLKTTLQHNPDIRQLIGFSVGASVCWQLLADEEIQSLEQGFCFYGSQIRHQLDLRPLRPIHLILPREEPSFDLQAMAQMLRGVALTELIHTPYLHGFMNSLSANFDAIAYRQYSTWLRAELSEPDKQQ